MPAEIGRSSTDLVHGQARVDEAPTLERLMAEVAVACVRAERLVVLLAVGLEQSIIASAADELLAAYRGLVRAREVGQGRHESQTGRPRPARREARGPDRRCASRPLRRGLTPRHGSLAEAARA